MPVPAGAIAERRLVNRLLSAKATSRESAHPLDGLRWVEERRLGRLRAAGVICEAEPGRYYLDTTLMVARFTARRQRAAIALMVLLLLFAASVYFGWTFVPRPA